MNIKRRTFTYFALLFIFLFILSAFTLAFSRRVEGESMMPTLEPGDLVIIENVPISKVSVGDIIIFNAPYFDGCSDFTIIHRVVAIAPDGGLITQGDNRLTNPNPDEPPGGPYVYQQCLVGKVIFVIPYIERIASLFPYPTNYALAILIVLLLVITELRGSKEREHQ